MKKPLLIIGIALAAMVTHAQTVITTTITTNASGGITSISTTNTEKMPSGGISWAGLLTAGEQVFGSLKGATNWAVAPYATYGMQNHKFGGGVLVLYDFNNFVGGGMAIDELGSLSVVSGTLQLKLPFKPLAFTGWSWATNLVTTPFVYSGVGAPIGSSAGSGVVTHEGEGISFDVTTLWGGELSLGAAYIQRQGAGPVYSGNYLNPFIAWRKGF